MTQQSVSHDPPAGCLIRLFWMFGGTSILFLCAFYIIHNHVRGLALIDLGYWLTVVAMVAARWVDISSYHGDTATGEPATMSHWRRYVMILIVVALAAWIIVHLLAFTGILSPASTPAGTVP